MPELTTVEVDRIKNELLDSFARFAAALSGPDWYDPILHRDLCNYLQFGGTEKGVELPRSFLKTTMTSTYYALWRAIEKKIRNKKDIRILIVSNTAPNSEKTIHEIRSIVENHPIVQQFFPEVIPNFGNTRWSDRSACLARSYDYPEATFESAGVGTAIIRRHYDIIIEDDTIAPSKDNLTGTECMPTKDDIEKAIGFHKLTTPLFVDPIDKESVFVGTRWGQSDVIGYIKNHETSFKWFSRKALNEEGKPNYFRYNMSILDLIKEKMGSFMFSMLYMNTPISSEQQKFKPEWIQYYRLNHDSGDSKYIVLPEGGRMVLTGDPADPPTGKAKQDYTALLMCYQHSRGMFAREYVRKRLKDSEIYKECIRLCETYHCNTIYLEKNRAANMIHGLNDFIRAKNLFIQVIPITNTRNKEDRIMGLVPIIEQGRFFLLPGMKELEEELMVFPYGEHDDLVDSLAMQMGEYKNVERVPNERPKNDNSIGSFDSIFKELTSRGNEGWFNTRPGYSQSVHYTKANNGPKESVNRDASLIN